MYNSILIEFYSPRLFTNNSVCAMFVKRFVVLISLFISG